jgi:hypothetical protein
MASLNVTMHAADYKVSICANFQPWAAPPGAMGRYIPHYLGLGVHEGACYVTNHCIV